MVSYLEHLGLSTELLEQHTLLFYAGWDFFATLLLVCFFR